MVFSEANRVRIVLNLISKLVYARVLGELMAERLQLIYADREKPEIIIPVPLHKKRLKERGFNEEAISSDCLTYIEKIRY